MDFLTAFSWKQPQGIINTVVVAGLAFTMYKILK